MQTKPKFGACSHLAAFLVGIWFFNESVQGKQVQLQFQSDQSAEFLPSLSDNPSSSKCKEHYSYHVETSACYQVGSQGPCGDRMRFEANDSLIGHCVCNNDGAFGKPLVQIGNQCYLLYTQAVCPGGHWLISYIPGEERVAVCQKNPCPDDDTGNVVLFNGKCVSLHTRSHNCPGTKQVVYFPEGKLLPACGTPPDIKKSNFKTKKAIIRTQRSVASVSAFVQKCSIKNGYILDPIRNRCVRIKQFTRTQDALIVIVVS